jgi:hypothetical protein
MKLVFPVRFAEGERVVQTTADEVTENGTYVITTTPPAVGAAVTLSLYLPDSADPVNASGVVRTAERGDQRPGFAVEFSSIAADGLVRIRKVLQLAQSTGAPNLRAFPARPVHGTAAGRSATLGECRKEASSWQNAAYRSYGLGRVNFGAGLSFIARPHPEASPRDRREVAAPPLRAFRSS